MAPSHLQIATSALQRLVKEEQSYHKELAQQQSRIAKLEAKEGDPTEDTEGNAEFELKQEVT
jgi:tubulin-specific chaperone A